MKGKKRKYNCTLSLLQFVLDFFFFFLVTYVSLSFDSPSFSLQYRLCPLVSLYLLYHLLLLVQLFLFLPQAQRRQCPSVRCPQLILSNINLFSGFLHLVDTEANCRLTSRYPPLNIPPFTALDTALICSLHIPKQTSSFPLTHPKIHPFLSLYKFPDTPLFSPWHSHLYLLILFLI